MNRTTRRALIRAAVIVGIILLFFGLLIVLTQGSAIGPIAG
jgi:hypothetical protein